MKNIIIFSLFFTTFLGCAATNSSQAKADHVLKPTKDGEGKWELHVLDSQFDYFLNAIAKPKNFYTESYLIAKNNILVSEWNALYYSGKYRNVIESSIDYDPNENYGFDFNYKLYQVFAFVNWKYGLKFTGFTSW